MSEHVESILTEVREAIAGRLGEDWTSFDLEWYDIGGFQAPRVVHVTGPGSARDEELPPGGIGLLADLVEALATPDAGAPISVSLYGDRNEAGLGCDVNWDRRIAVDAEGRDVEGADDDAVRPTRAEWRRELERHPRPPEAIPAWWSALLGTGSAADPAAVLDAAAERPSLTPAASALEAHPVTRAFLPRLVAWILDLARGLDARRLAALVDASAPKHAAVAGELVRDAAGRASNAALMRPTSEIAEFVRVASRTLGTGVEPTEVAPAVASQPLLVSERSDQGAAALRAQLDATIERVGHEVVAAKFH